MNFFEMIEKRQTQEPVKQDNSLTLDMVRRDWYRQGIDPDLATKAWEWARDNDKDGTLADFFDRYFDKETGSVKEPLLTHADLAAEALVVLESTIPFQKIPNPGELSIGPAPAKRKPGRPKKVKE